MLAGAIVRSWGRFDPSIKPFGFKFLPCRLAAGASVLRGPDGHFVRDAVDNRSPSWKSYGGASVIYGTAVSSLIALVARGAPPRVSGGRSSWFVSRRGLLRQPVLSLSNFSRSHSQPCLRALGMVRPRFWLRDYVEPALFKRWEMCRAFIGFLRRARVIRVPLSGSDMLAVGYPVDHDSPDHHGGRRDVLRRCRHADSKGRSPWAQRGGRAQRNAQIQPQRACSARHPRLARAAGETMAVAMVIASYARSTLALRARKQTMSSLPGGEPLVK